jgi:hypothetical protein
VGEGGVVRARAHVVRREQAQIVRLVLICTAWTIGQMLTYGLSIQGFDVIIPAGLAVGVYVATDDLGRPGFGGRGGGSGKYWRGRPVDDERRDRLN